MFGRTQAGKTCPSHTSDAQNIGKHAVYLIVWGAEESQCSEQRRRQTNKKIKTPKVKQCLVLCQALTEAQFKISGNVDALSIAQSYTPTKIK